jgi:short-subunit dehydrogenase
MKRRTGSTRIHRPVVWVVGASRGIGREIAAEFASIGAEVCLSGRNARALEAAVKEIEGHGGRAHAFPCNIAAPRSILATVVRIRNRVGDIDVLVNNAGVTLFRSFLDTSLTEFHQIIATNLEGQVACVKAVLPSMVSRKRGWIITIHSTAAVHTFTNSAAYTATKAGMHALTKVLREEMRPHGVRVVNVLPGATETAMWSAADRKKHGKRMMRPRSVAEAVLAAYQMPDDVIVEELVVRPQLGDIS